MLVEHQGTSPTIHETAYVAPTATISGAVSIGENSCVLHHAVITADGGAVSIGHECVVMEHAVLRGTPKHPLTVGNNVLVGPHAYLTGCTVEDNTFLATASTVFNGARLGAGSEVRINGTVHIKTTLPEETMIPIGWVAVGEPPEILPPEAHDEIWHLQEPLDFPRFVFGLERAPPSELMPALTQRYTAFLKRHQEDTVL